MRRSSAIDERMYSQYTSWTRRSSSERSSSAADTSIESSRHASSPISGSGSQSRGFSEARALRMSDDFALPETSLRDLILASSSAVSPTSSLPSLPPNHPPRFSGKMPRDMRRPINA